MSYWWYARAVDQPNGVKSSPANGRFRVVASTATVFRLQVSPPCPSYSLSGPSLFVSLLDGVGNAHMLIQSSGTLTLTLFNHGRGVLSGTIGGAADGYSFAASPSDSSPAPVAGHLNSDGTISGTFDGYVTGHNTYGDSRNCNAPGFLWTLTPFNP